MLTIAFTMTAPRYSRGQIYADSAYSGTTSGIGNSASVTNPLNAVNVNLTDSARLTASSTLGTSTAWLHTKFKTTTIPASGFIFIRYNSTTALLGSEITTTAYNNTSIAGTSYSQIVYDTGGVKYLAVSSTSAYNGVRLTLSSPIALGTNTADVFYTKSFNKITCNPFITTGTTIGGVASVGAGVSNPTNAIDGNLSSYAQFNTGVSLGAIITQSFYLDTVNTNSNAVTLAFASPSSLISLSALNNISLQAYLGNGTVGSATNLGSLVSLDLLGLLQNGQTILITLPVSSNFNRIDFQYSALLSLLDGFRLYEVSITPQKPTFTLPKNDTIYVCSGSNAILTADAASAGNELRWYTSASASGVLIGTGDSVTTNFAVTTDTVFYAATGKTGCTASSERVPLRILVKPVPIKPTVADKNVCSGDTTTFSVNPSSPSNTYTWYSTASGGTSLATGADYTTAALTDTTTFYIQSDSVNGCSSLRDTAVAIVLPLPGISFINPADACELDLIKNVLYTDTVALNTAGQYGISWNAAAQAALFTDIPDSTLLPASFFPINIPSDTAPENYYGTLKISGVNGCRTNYVLQLNIEARPEIIVNTSFQ